tara:strand:+ start:298 stop:426 length:129 start_codon:yes stop_codon:yes gene_type:complete
MVPKSQSQPGCFFVFFNHEFLVEQLLHRPALSKLVILLILGL